MKTLIEKKVHFVR